MDGDVLSFAQVMAVCIISTASFVGIGFAGRFLWLRGSPRPLATAPVDEHRMQRLETAVDTIAVEVERISEAQRFMVGLLSESIPARRAERAGELAAPDRAGRVITPH